MQQTTHPSSVEEQSVEDRGGRFMVSVIERPLANVQWVAGDQSHLMATFWANSAKCPMPLHAECDPTT
jgi:hypothetical protein